MIRRLWGGFRNNDFTTTISQPFTSISHRFDGNFTTISHQHHNGFTPISHQFSQRIHNAFTMISHHCHISFATISLWSHIFPARSAENVFVRRFHIDLTLDFTTISHRFHNDFTTMSHRFTPISHRFHNDLHIDFTFISHLYRAERGDFFNSSSHWTHSHPTPISQRFHIFPARSADKFFRLPPRASRSQSSNFYRILPPRASRRLAHY